MERIRADVIRVKAPTRVKPEPAHTDKSDPIESTSPKMLKRLKVDIPDKVEPKIIASSGRIYDGGMIKDAKTGMFWNDKDGEYYKKIDGHYFKCWPDGCVKDQQTKTHVCWFGKITPKPTEAELLRVSVAIQRAQIKSRPDWYFGENGEKINPVDEDGNLIYKHVTK